MRTIITCTALLSIHLLPAQLVDRVAGARLPRKGQYLIAAVEHDFVLPPGVVLPRRLDMSSYFPVAGDQKRQASCTAWALAYGLASFMNNWENDRRPDKRAPPDPRQVFSPAFLFNMVKRYAQPDSNCLSGVDIGATFTIACEWGNCPLEIYPYDSRNSGCGDPIDTTLFRVTTVHRLPTPVALWHSHQGVGPTQVPFDPVQWKYHIARKEPVVVSLSIDCSFIRGGDSAASAGRPFIWDDLALDMNDTCYGGHAMVCTGYDDQDSTFTFLNSFGEEWGDHGYVKITYRALREIGSITREAYVFSQRWWNNLPVPAGKPVRSGTLKDSTLNASIKQGMVHRLYDMEVRVVTVSPDGKNMVVQFTDTAGTRPAATIEFPIGVKRSFLYEDKLWSFTWSEQGLLAGLFSNAVPFSLKADADDDEKLEEAIDRHFQQWRANEKDP